MTKKLYYDDPYIKSFSTKCKMKVQDEEGWFVVLEETAFYPTGGGQPYDVGLLNNVGVYRVEERKGEVRHYIKDPLPINEGDRIEGSINWTRRFDHMQQHAGQHLLSAAFEELFQYETVGFHLGETHLTIDLNIDQLTIDQAFKAEQLSNQIILENRQIDTRWVNEQDLSDYPLRKMPTVSEDIRLVVIDNFDYNGCGGTHPSSTGQIRAIKILGWERQRTKIRIQFICGERVLSQFQSKHKLLVSLGSLLHSSEETMVEAVERLQQKEKNLEKSLESEKEKVMEAEVQGLMKNKMNVNGHSLICTVYKGRSMQDLQKITRMIVENNEYVIAFVVCEYEKQLRFVLGRGKNVEVNVKEIGNHLIKHINGKGGGNEAFIQGGGEKVVLGEELLEFGLVLFKQLKN
ncbi:DHHA1 domain-containing protein [Evansella sp. AB-P1]|uniref:alanyl-tRNA editing protein n=1 Tax=Evansella sp. AB-P1 TaxID=3037653 RepID=UPI00241CB2B5|nr:DHHA1 domain-containing protein [Evansella sp. AB-P1]MDG5789569.1 DHHA1 domain-containing protein [Evansella sp. AB-P1]